MSEPINQEELAQRLAAFIAAQTGQTVTIREMEPLAGGASLDSWRVVAQVGAQEERLVLRRDLETVMIAEALSREQEFKVLQAAYASGVRAPRPRWLCTDPAVLGKPFFLMDYVEGVSIGRVIVKRPEFEPARQVLPQLMAEQIALIHAIDIQAHGLDFLLAPAPGLSPALQAVRSARQALAKLDAHHPVFEFGLRWLEQHAPPCSQITLVHGDFRLGNFLIGYPHGLNAVIDWEFCHQGDPLEDLAWPCVRDWRFGMGQLRLAGVAEREPFLVAYEERSGRSVDRRAVDYWEIMGNLRWAVTCLEQANRHLSGRDPSVEFASLGRRSAEMQYEMLRLIEQQGG
jgi:aminoglycoside phosphotransferase (APT) family kinase protein